MRRITIGTIGVAALLAGLVLTPSLADAQLTSDECGCQTATGKAQSKFVQSKQKCVTKCEAGARKGKNPVTDCDPPYAGTTAACVDKAEAKAIQTGSKGKCLKDCPECYSGGDCPADATARTAGNEAQVDAFVPLIYCEPAPTDPDEQKCQDAQAKAAGAFVKAKSTCYAKCRALECKGKVPAGSCTPPATDPKTVACIQKAEGKCTSGIDKKCTGTTPACSAFQTSAGLCAAIEAAVDGAQADTYCASPSGAFLE